MSSIETIGWRLSPQPDWQSAQQQPKAGRWHYAGAQVVYASATPELAVLEALAHHQPGQGPYWLCRVYGDVHASRASIDVSELPRTWRREKSVTRALGTDWLDSGRTVVLEVPSALCEVARNLLVNPSLAPARRWRIERISRFRFDRRLVHKP